MEEALPSTFIPTLFDTHCHLDFDAFPSTLDSVIASARTRGVTRFLIPSVGHWNWQKVATLSNSHPEIYYALGMHPYFFVRHEPQDSERLLSIVMQQDDKCVAIGECGLDFYDSAQNKAAQLSLLEAHIDIANQCQLPIILHCRKAHQEMVSLLKRQPAQYGGVIHGFTGSYQQACDYLKLGFHLGVGGSITYERAKKTRNAIQHVPLASIVLETDAPDMPISGFQGMPNHPDRLPYVLRSLSTIRSEPIAEIANITLLSSCELFGI